MTIPISPAASGAAAEVLLADYGQEYDNSHLSSADFADQANRVLQAAVPHLALDATQYEQFLSYLGESVHTAFRKAAESEQAHVTWLAIREMPEEEWRSVLSFITGCITMGYAITPTFETPED